MRAAAWLAILPVLGGGCLTSRIRYEESAPPRSAAALADEAAVRFLFYTGDQRVPGDLESVSRLYRRPGDGAEVLLVPMIHFADRSFYDAVAERLAGADVVLMEGSAGAAGDGGAASGEAGPSEIAAVFAALDLVAQPEREKIGPPGPRYIEGDIDRADLAARIEAVRGGGGDGWSPPAFPHAVFTWDRFWYAVAGRTANFRRAWRHLFAIRLRPLEGESVRLLIAPRDEALLKRLDAEIAARPANRARFRIAVPWGSEHMPGIERGLLGRRFAPVASGRLTAWRVRGYESE